MPLSKILPNFVLFQLGWFACVLGGAGQWHVAGSLVAMAIVVFHLSQADQWAREMRLLLIALAVGVVWESVLVATGLLIYTHGQLATWLAPHWIMVMWVLFATTFNVSLSWLKHRPILSVLMGAVGGPLAFLAGQSLGAVEIPNDTLAVLVLAVGWGLLVPLMMHLSTRWNGFSTAHEEKS